MGENYPDKACLDSYFRAAKYNPFLQGFTGPVACEVFKGCGHCNWNGFGALVPSWGSSMVDTNMASRGCV